MADFLLTESGVRLLQETGDKILLEEQGATVVGLSGVLGTGSVGDVLAEGGDQQESAHRGMLLLGVG